MIFENDCLFLFKKDLVPDLREIHPKDVNIKMFIKPDLNIDKFSEYLKTSSVVVYVDSDRRLINYISGSKKGKVEQY